MSVLLNWLIKLINKSDGYKTIAGVFVLLVGGLMYLWPVTAPYAADVIYFGLGLLGVGAAHKVVKAAAATNAKPYSADNVKEIVLALIQSANTIADVTKERFNLDKFIKEHLDEIIKLVPLITTAIQDSAKVVEELKVLSHEDEQWIINELVRLDFPDDKAQELAKSGVKALLYLAQLGSRLR